MTGSGSRSASADDRLSASYDVALYLESLHDLVPPGRVARGRAGGPQAGRRGRGDGRAGRGGVRARRAHPSSGCSPRSSVIHCLPVGRSEPGLRRDRHAVPPSVLRDYATRAGFGSVEVSAIEHDMFRFYVLR